MSYRVTKIDNSIERRICIGAIVSDKFIKSIRSIYKPEYMLIPFAKIVMEWCLDYFNQYQKAPLLHIKDIFIDRKHHGLESELADIIEEFLSSIAHEYAHAEHFNVEFLLNECEKRFNSVSQLNLQTRIDELRNDAKYEEADGLIAEYKPVKLPKSKGINPYNDKEAIRQAFEEEEGETLFKLPGALGELVGDLHRDDFWMLMGESKAGKSWWCQWFADWAYRARCNVALFQCGDMGQKKSIKRLAVQNTGKNYNYRYCGPRNRPILDCRKNQDGTCGSCPEPGVIVGHVDEKSGFWIPEFEENREFHRICTKCMQDNPKEFVGAFWYEIINIELLSWEEAYERGCKIVERSKHQFKLSTHFNTSINVKEIDIQLEQWKDDEGFIPDLILPDYPDIFKAEDPRIVEERLKVDARWKALRALGQKWNAAIIAPTQAAATSYDRKTLKKKDFADSRTKYDHVTGVLTLNALDIEKMLSVMRIGAFNFREEYFSEDEDATITVMQCLAQGKPYLGSYVTPKANRT